MPRLSWNWGRPLEILSGKWSKEIIRILSPRINNWAQNQNYFYLDWLNPIIVENWESRWFLQWLEEANQSLLTNDHFSFFSELSHNSLELEISSCDFVELSASYLITRWKNGLWIPNPPPDSCNIVQSDNARSRIGRSVVRVPASRSELFPRSVVQCDINEDERSSGAGEEFLLSLRSSLNATVVVAFREAPRNSFL